MNRLVLRTFVAACAVYAAGASGHHSSAPHFDSDKTITVDGIIREIRLVNPHAYIYIDEMRDGESVSWRCELSSATQLRRWGWTASMFVPGQAITVTGALARREANVCYMGSLTLAGPWRSKSFGRGAAGIRPQYVASEAGKAAVGSYDMAFDDPILRCHIVNIIGAWNHDENVNDIAQGDDLITIQYGFMDFVRTVHLGMSEHPSSVTPSAGGHSTGRWDGDTMADPLYLVGVTQGQDFMEIADAPHTRYNCVELSGKNNIRPEEKPWWKFWD